MLAAGLPVIGESDADARKRSGKEEKLFVCEGVSEQEFDEACRWWTNHATRPSLFSGLQNMLPDRWWGDDNNASRSRLLWILEMNRDWIRRNNGIKFVNLVRDEKSKQEERKASLKRKVMSSVTSSPPDAPESCWEWWSTKASRNTLLRYSRDQTSRKQFNIRCEKSWPRQRIMNQWMEMREYVAETKEFLDMVQSAWKDQQDDKQHRSDEIKFKNAERKRIRGVQERGVEAICSWLTSTMARPDAERFVLPIELRPITGWSSYIYQSGYGSGPHELLKSYASVHDEKSHVHCAGKVCKMEGSVIHLNPNVDLRMPCAKHPTASTPSEIVLCRSDTVELKMLGMGDRGFGWRGALMLGECDRNKEVPKEVPIYCDVVRAMYTDYVRCLFPAAKVPEVEALILAYVDFDTQFASFESYDEATRSSCVDVLSKILVLGRRKNGRRSASRL